MKKLYINFDASVEIVNDDPGDGSPYSGYRETDTYISLHGLERETEDAFSESIDVSDSLYDKDEGYLVTVRYKTGNTFGQQHGQYKFIAVFEDSNLAFALAKEIRKDNEDSEDYTFIPKTKNEAYEEIHCSWKGYFERLEDVEVTQLMIL